MSWFQDLLSKEVNVCRYALAGAAGRARFDAAIADEFLTVEQEEEDAATAAAATDADADAGGGGCEARV